MNPPSAQRTIEPLNCGIHCRSQSFAHEADNFFAQGVASARPGFHPSKMLYARLQRAKLEIIGADLNEAANSLFQKIEKCELIARAGMVSDVE